MCTCVCVCTLIRAPGLGTHTSPLGERLRAQLQTQCCLFPRCTRQEFMVGKGPSLLRLAPETCLLCDGSWETPS